MSHQRRTRLVPGGRDDDRFRDAWRRALAVCLCALLLPLGAGGAGAAEEPPHRYSVELAAYRKPDRARAAAVEARRRLGEELPLRVEYHAPFHALRVGAFASAAEAEEVLARVQRLGWTGAWIAATQVTPEESAQAARAQAPETEAPDVRTDAERPAEPSREALPPPAPESPAAPAAPPADGASPAPPRPAPKRLVAARAGDDALVLDGRLDEAAWSSATFSTDFQQKLDTGGGAAAERTEVAFLYDDEALWVGARMHLRDPAALRAPRGRRDDGADADRLIVSLDTYRNRQTAYNFGVTAGGARVDYYQPEDVFEVRDYTFDPVWDARVSLEPAGWTAEMRIPFSSLRFHDAPSQVWGVNVQRVTPAQRLYAFWVVVPGNETGWASRFGELVGIAGVQPPRRVALVPYAAGQSVRAPSGAAPAIGAGEDDDVEWRYGGDLLVDLAPNLSLEATFNPDFGQIEADPAVVNLTAFEVFLPERRPFFLDGADLLRGPGPRYFYSRRVGAPPRGGFGRLEDRPQSTTIPGAAKLIGRFADGRSVAALVALTEEESARLVEPSTGAVEAVPVEPQTFFGVLRLQKDFGAGSRVGWSATGVDRSFPETGGLAGLLPQRAWASGTDWALRFAGQTHELGGYLGGSLVEGDPAAIDRLQRSSARYYQRPDADHVELDPGATRLTGYTGQLHLSRIQGAFRWTLSGEARSPGFEINDAGAMATADDLVGFGQMSYGQATRRGPLHRYDVALSAVSGWNFGGVRQFTSPSLQLDAVWRNFWKTHLRVTRELEALSDSLTRGGPLMGTPAGWSSRFGLSSNDARRQVWGLDGWYATDDLGGRSWSASPRLLLRAGERFTFAVAPGFEQGSNTRQYVATLADGPAATFGQRYVFGELDRRTLFVRLRAGLAFARRAGLDLYIEPFAASGRYDRFGELLAPRSRDLRLYGTSGTTLARAEDGSWLVTEGDRSFTLPDPDFDVLSLRGNAVLHWEYAPGSTLYLVWSQQRGAGEGLGEPVGPGDLADTFSIPAHDVFAVKASFRFDVGSWR